MAKTNESIQNTGLIEFNGYFVEKMASELELQAIIQRLADEIYRDHKGRDLLLVGVLKGANVFVGDLGRELGRGNPEIGRLPMPVEIDFLQVASYDGEQSTGEIKKKLDLSADIKDRDVILVEDIVDTGQTLKALKADLQKRSPASLSVCVFLDKPDRRKVFLKPEYTGKVIPDKFVVGYGLDWNQAFRNLPFVGVVMGKAS